MSTENSSQGNGQSLATEVKHDLTDSREQMAIVEQNFESVRGMQPNALSASDAKRMVSEDLEAMSNIRDDENQLHALRYIGANVVSQQAYRAEIEANYEEISARAEQLYIEQRAIEQERNNQAGKAKARGEKEHLSAETSDQEDYADLERDAPANGVVLIDGKTATSVAFSRQGEGADTGYDLTYKIGSKAIHRERAVSSAELERILGPENAQTIKGSDQEKGVLKGEDLIYVRGLSREAATLVAESDLVKENQKAEQARLDFEKETKDRVAAIHNRERATVGGERNEIINTSAIEQDRKVGAESNRDASKGTAQKDLVSSEQNHDSNADPLSEIAAKIRDDLNKRYILTGKDYHFRDQGSDLAFSAGRSSISTELDKPLVARDMVALAVSNGWTAIEVKGSENFKREAWLEGSLYGLNVSGYKAREVDLIKLEELKAERDKEIKAPKNQVIDISQQATVDRGESVKSNVVPIVQAERDASKRGLATTETQALREMEHLMRERGDSEQAIKMAREAAAARLTQKDNTVVGRIIEHGAARYNFDKDENHSYYVKLETRTGEKTIWGVGLQEAVEKSQAKEGELVALQNKGKKDVTVDAPVRNEAREVVGRQKVESHRNAWEVVSLDQMNRVGNEHSGMTMRLPQSYAQDRAQQSPNVAAANNGQSLAVNHADLER